MSVVATVAGTPILVSEVDARENHLRETRLAASLPRPGTSEGRQLRRWLTQLLIAERVVTAEADARGTCAVDAPTKEDLVPDTVARMEIGSIAASVLDEPRTRALFVDVTAGVSVSEADVADYHARNPRRFVSAQAVAGSWNRPATTPDLAQARPAIAAHLLAAARRRAFRRWLDARVHQLAELSPGYEHPGDPRQPDNTHRH